MTSGAPRTSDGERRLAGFLRLCDYVIYWGLGGSAASAVFQNMRIVGLGLLFVSFGAAFKLGSVIVAYLLMSFRSPNENIAPWIRSWTRIASVLMGLAALYALIAGHNAGTRLLAAVIALLALLLYRRVGSLSIGEMDVRGGPHAHEMFLWRRFLTPELDAWLAGIWLAGAIVLRAALPSAFRPAERAVTQHDLKQRVLAVYLAERRYHRAHGRYSSDLGELRPLASPQIIDSLVIVTVDALGYRAVARDPRGTMSCGGWGGAVATSLRIEGLAEGNIFCWVGRSRR